MPASITGMMASVVVLSLFALVALALLRRSPLTDVVGDEDEFPMAPLEERILNDDDSDFVAAVGDPELVARFRAHRREVMRLRMDQLSREFERTSMAMRRCLAEADEDRPDLMGLLMRESWRFHAAMIWQRGCLALHWLGLRPNLQWPELSLARIRECRPEPAVS